MSGREIWVVLDPRSPALFDHSLKVLALGRAAAAPAGLPVIALALGSSAGPAAGCLLPGCLSLAEAANEAARFADRVIGVDHPDLAAPRADLIGSALADLYRARSPLLVLVPITDLGREAASRAARLVNAGVIADAVDLHLDGGGRVVARCPAWGGEVMAEITLADGQPGGFVTVRPLGGLATEAARPGSIELFKPAKLDAPAGLAFVSCCPVPEEHRRLADAPRIVAGGAGLGSAENFHRLRELAAALSAEVGATRPAVMSHWADEERLIGQTGVTARPDLAVVVGASGAVQFTAGLADAGLVVAVNRDPAAPIFRAADLGVVADAREFVPAFTAAVKKALMRQLADLLCAAPSLGAPSGLGPRVRELREGHNWSREDLAQSTGQSPEFIEQVETGEVTPSVAFLLRLARALGIDPSAFLTEEEKTNLRDQRADAFVKRTQNYWYETLTPGAVNEHLRAFRITIEPRQAHKPVAYKHEGEEFVFVMEGELELTVGQKRHLMKPGESMHFNSDVPHKLVNLADTSTICLVVLFTP